MSKIAEALPWTKDEIIAAALAEIEPPRPPGFASVKPTPLCILARLALGRPEGRASPAQEHALLIRIDRVCRGVKAGQDPAVACDQPLPGERPLTGETQMGEAYQRAARLLDEMEAGIRAGERPGSPANIFGAFRRAIP